MNTICLELSIYEGAQGNREGNSNRNVPCLSLRLFSVFPYGADGKPVVMNYNGSMYGFLYNVQGDVVALFDQSGEVTVRYRYGAWGELLRCWGVEAETVGTVQPFRYRGYLWDWETGDYYCQSRQYRSGWRRFVNADALIKGNMYCYCENDPVLFSDSSGYIATLANDRIFWCSCIYE